MGLRAEFDLNSACKLLEIRIQKKARGKPGFFYNHVSSED